jgi:hypothetical protein
MVVAAIVVTVGSPSSCTETAPSFASRQAWSVTLVAAPGPACEGTGTLRSTPVPTGAALAAAGAMRSIN